MRNEYINETYDKKEQEAKLAKEEIEAKVDAWKRNGRMSWMQKVYELNNLLLQRAFLVNYYIHKHSLLIIVSFVFIIQFHSCKASFPYIYFALSIHQTCPSLLCALTESLYGRNTREHNELARQSEGIGMDNFEELKSQYDLMIHKLIHTLHIYKTRVNITRLVSLLYGRPGKL